MSPRNGMESTARSPASFTSSGFGAAKASSLVTVWVSSSIALCTSGEETSPSITISAGSESPPAKFSSSRTNARFPSVSSGSVLTPDVQQRQDRRQQGHRGGDGDQDDEDRAAGQAPEDRVRDDQQPEQREDHRHPAEEHHTVGRRTGTAA